MISTAETTSGEKVFIDTGIEGGTVRITIGNGSPFYLTVDEARKVMETLMRHLPS